MRYLWSVYGSQIRDWRVLKEMANTYAIEGSGRRRRLNKAMMWLNGEGDFYETEQAAVEAAIENGQAAIDRAEQVISEEEANLVRLKARLI